jgi:translocation and assembly module TamB
MTKRRIAALLAVSVVVTALLAVGTAGAWLLYTEAGLAWIVARAGNAAGEGLTLEGVAGTLAGGTSARHIRFAGDDIEVRANDAYLRLSPYSILMLTPRLSELRATELIVTTRPGEPRGRPPDTLELPMNVQLPDVSVGRLVIDMGKGPMDITDVRLAYSGGRSRHTVHKLALGAFDHALELKGTIDAQAPFAIDAELHATRLAEPQARIRASFGGNLSEMAVKATATSGEARVEATGQVEPYAAFPLAAVKAHIEKLDLRALLKELPRTAIAGDIELTRVGKLLAGPVQITNALHGPYDTQRLPVAALRVGVRTDAGSMQLTELTADLGAAGVIRGSGNLQADRAELALTTKALNLAGIHTRMRKTQLAGRADLALTEARQSARATVSQDDISVELVAHRAGDLVEVPKLSARARGGVATGEGRVELSAQQPFSTEVTFSRFDPAAWGDFPGGSINGTIAARGTIANRAADVKLAITNSRWLDAALEARGTLSIAGDRLRSADVTLALGGNTMSAQGAFGTPRDRLAVKLDARRLGVVDKRLQGAISGSGVVSGSWNAPGLRFDLSGSQLAYEKTFSIEALSARGFVSTDPKGTAEIDATLRGVSAPEGDLRSVSFRVQGTRAAHTGVLQAQGERVNFRARASGGWRPGTGWSGMVQELVNSGEAAIRLVAPFALTAGPGRVHAEPFELRVVGGQLHMNALDYARGRVRTAGRFSDLPVRPFLVIAGAPADMVGTLRLRGDWSIESTPQLSGSVNIARESGDVTLGTERVVSMGLEALSLNARFTPSGAELKAELRSRVATGSAEGRVAPIGSGAQARYAGASPLAFTASVDVARFAPFAAFIDTAMLLEGRAHARVKGTGTVASPLITGTITADNIAVALPADGVDLKQGRLRAVLAQREIRVESFSIQGGDGVFTARGTLARTGFDEASVDWTAKSFRVLGRPDRRLVVSGNGNAALRSGKLAFTGALRADEGLFEIATTELPTLGDDVVVVGRPGGTLAAAETAPREKPRQVTRASVDMTVDLGEKVQLRGRGLSVWLAGKLAIQTNARGELRASGLVTAEKGTFVAYGQRLEIDRARFYFNGPITNPGLDIVAMRKRQAVEAGVAVTGTLDRPLVRVVSNPAVPEGEALSWLMLGRAPDKVGASQLSALPLATSALVDKAGAPVARALKLDDVGVRSDAAAQQFLTVGKRLTDRLYLAFEQSLGGTENLLRLEFTLTQRIALRAETGTASSVGVFYRYVWD